MGFLIWSGFGIALMILGIYCHFTKRLMYFWANDTQLIVSDQKAYNRTLGKCWIVYGLIFIVLGLPLLSEYKMWALFSVLASFFWMIALILSYLRISDRYRLN